VSINRFNFPFFQGFVGSTGAVGAGWQLYFWATGTTDTAQTVYSDSARTVAHTNPVVADSNGRWADIFLGDESYNVELYDENGVLLDSADPVGAAVTSSAVVGREIETHTATYGQTTFTLTGMTYTPGSNNLMVIYNGAIATSGVDYTETSSSVVTWTGTTVAASSSMQFIKNSFVSSSAPLAANVSYTPNGAGAVVTNVQAKLRETVSVFDFMTAAQIADVQANTALVDVTTAVTNGDTAATAAGKQLFFPAGTYLTTANIPSTCRWVGENVLTTVIKKGANCDMVNAGEGWQAENLTLDGDGATYTGKGVVVLTSTGRQKALKVNIIDMDDYCIDFVTTTAGSQSDWSQMKISRTLGTTSGYEAVHIEDAVQAAAYPRKFSHIESEGSKFLQAGGCNHLSIVDSYIGNITYSANSKGVSLVNSRAFTNETAVSMRGFNHTITGCNVAPVITLESGVGECAITGNSYNQTIPLVDNSGSGGRNLLDGPSVAYTPAFTTSGTAPAIGDGSIAGHYSRHGASITVTILLTVGSTTTFGTGDLRFGIPLVPVQGSVAAAHGMAVVTDTDGGPARTLCAVQVATGVNYAILLQSGTAGPVGGTTPYTLATGDTIRLTITYTI